MESVAKLWAGEHPTHLQHEEALGEGVGVLDRHFLPKQVEGGPRLQILPAHIRHVLDLLQSPAAKPSEQ